MSDKLVKCIQEIMAETTDIVMLDFLKGMLGAYQSIAKAENAKKPVETQPKAIRKRRVFKTEEERIAAHAEDVRKYYETHKERIKNAVRQNILKRRLAKPDEVEPVEV